VRSSDLLGEAVSKRDHRPELGKPRLELPGLVRLQDVRERVLPEADHQQIGPHPGGRNVDEPRRARSAHDHQRPRLQRLQGLHEPRDPGQVPQIGALPHDPGLRRSEHGEVVGLGIRGRPVEHGDLVRQALLATMGGEAVQAERVRELLVGAAVPKQCD
jgi:hypothetical protein